MKIKYFLSVMIVFFVLTACAEQKTLYFEGESDSWKVKYVTDVVASDNSEQGTIHVLYIGENDAPNQITYKIETGSGSMSGDLPMQDGALETSGSNCSGCTVTKEEDYLDMTIEWDGKAENFTLKNVN